MKSSRILRVPAGLTLLFFSLLAADPAAAASLRGRVLDAATGEPIGEGVAFAFVSEGDWPVAGAAIDPDLGTFDIAGLEPGVSHYLVIDGPEGRDLLVGGDTACMVADEASFEFPPPVATCDPTRGQAFTMAAAGDQADAGDIRLPAEGRIRGRIRLGEGRTDFSNVEIFTPGGRHPYRISSEEPVGEYDFDVSVPGGGSFFVAASSYEHRVQVYDGLDCPGDTLACLDLPQAKQVAVAPGAILEGIDFDLVLDRRPCAPSPTNLCLADGRFTVYDYHWEGNLWHLSQAGRITEEAGYFTFFDSANVELVVKVLDACENYGAFWVFTAGLTDVSTILDVRDNWAARTKTYRSRGPYRPQADTAAFTTCGLEPPEGWPAERPEATAKVAAPQPGLVPNGCGSDPTISLCLGDRFKVEASWETALGERGIGRPHALTADTGFFHFFSPDNIEVVVKVLNACRSDLNSHYWVFAAGLTDVAVTLTVTDTVTGEPRYYMSPLGGLFQPIIDFEAFASCS